MMDFELTVNKILERAQRYFPNKEVVTKLEDGTTHRYTYNEFHDRVNQLCNALDDMGLDENSTVSTLARNHYRHLELYFAPPMTGRAFNLANMRLPLDDVTYVINDAESKALFLDPQDIEKIEQIQDNLETIDQYIILDEEVPPCDLEPIVAYEDLISGYSTEYDPAEIDEDGIATICYTSGTTGRPKGAEFSHRAIFLKTILDSSVDTYGISERDTILQAVPMFHSVGWGIPYTAVQTGAKLVFPSPNYSAADMVDLINDEAATLGLGAVTIWVDVANYLEKEADRGIPDIERILAGAGKIPKSTFIKYEDEFNVELLHGWGMTETLATGTSNMRTTPVLEMDTEGQFQHLAKAGIPQPGINARIQDDSGHVVPRDGESIGELQVRGVWIIDSYHDRPDADADAFTDDGYLKTDDVATWDKYGYIDIVDRKKNLIKSGGEWISPLDLENHLMAHEGVSEAAVIAIPDEKWQERPLACIVPVDGQMPSEESLIEHVLKQFPKWWVPDDFIMADEIPRKGTDKFDKEGLKERLANDAGIETL